MEAPATPPGAAPPATGEEVTIPVSLAIPPIVPLHPMSPAISPAHSPERLRIDATAGPGPATPAHAAENRGRAPPAGSFDVYRADPAGGPRILENREYHRSLLVSHNRRDPASLNLTYALVGGMRTGVDPDTGQPFAKHCHKDSRRVELWLDKEQLAEVSPARRSACATSVPHLYAAPV